MFCHLHTGTLTVRLDVLSEGGKGGGGEATCRGVGALEGGEGGAQVYLHYVSPATKLPPALSLTHIPKGPI